MERAIGHEREQLKLDRLSGLSERPQSYLFSGPESVGKFRAALYFAQSLLGQSVTISEETGLPNTPDIFVLSPPVETVKGKTKEKNISIEMVREGLHFLSRHPISGNVRVLIIDRANRLSVGAENALLKTLEEPNSTSVLILVSADPERLLPTIRSRVQTISFGLVPTETIRNGVRLLGYDVSGIPDFFFGLGRPGVVIRALQNPEEFTKQQELLSKLFRLSRLTLRERLDLSEALALDLPLSLRLFEWWIPGLHEQAKKVSNERSLRAYMLFLGRAEETVRVLRETQANARLQFESLFMSM